MAGHLKDKRLQQKTENGDKSRTEYDNSEFEAIIASGKIPKVGMPPELAYRHIVEELRNDGDPDLNLSTFVNTCMDEWADRLITDNLNKNYVEHQEYPITNLIVKRMVWMIGSLFGSKFDDGDTPDDWHGKMYGSCTLGSSEAVMMGLIAHRKRWEINNRKNPKASPLDRPLIVLSTHAHTCWDKYCRYFGVGAIYIPMSDSKFVVTENDVNKVLSSPITDSPYREQIDEFCGYSSFGYDSGDRTVGELVMAVGAVVGTTYTGNSDQVDGIEKAIEDYLHSVPEAADRHVDIPIHVDAASAGFLLPFQKQNGREVPFSFRDSASRVRSINVSNHKFGNTYPGLGTVVFRDSTVVDSSLVYNISYLGGSFGEYAVNFTRSAAMILAGYYNLISWGINGYRKAGDNCLTNAKMLVDALTSPETFGRQFFATMSDNEHFPICVFKFADPSDMPSWTMEQFVLGLRNYGWIIPAYQLPTDDPESPDGIWAFRVVVRQIFSPQKIAYLVKDMQSVIGDLQSATNLRSRNFSREDS